MEEKDEVIKVAECGNEEVIEGADCEMVEVIKDAECEKEGIIEGADYEMEEVIKNAECEKEELVKDAVREKEEVVEDAEYKKEESVKDADYEMEKVIKDAECETKELVKDAVYEKEEIVKDAECEKQESVNGADYEMEEVIKDEKCETEELVKDAVREKKEVVKDAEYKKEESVKDALSEKEEVVKDGECVKEEVVKDTECEILEYKDFSVELEGFPHILKYIEKLQEQIKVQKNAIIKPKIVSEDKETQCDLSDRSLVDNKTQTDLSGDKSSQDWVISDSKETSSLAEQVKEAAESAVLQTGFVYEKTTGLYYHYESGYYYDPKSGLYYDGNNGAYYYYDESTKEYKFHSQIARDTTEPMDTSTTTKREKSDRKKNKGRPKRIKLSEDAEEPEVIEIEEGECSDSDSASSSSSVVEIITIGSPENNNEDISKDYPPCMRIIVQETNIPKLKIGTLFLVTCTGGSIGREGDHPVLIRDINISKHHAKLQYNEEKKVYEIIDLGSRNGTVVNGKRISAAKQESDATAIVHGSTLQVGSTKLLCHIHKGNETCGHCEPGLLVQATISAEPAYRSTKADYESEMKRIKNKFGLKEENTEASRVATGYQDRAQSRRKNVGSSCQFAKTQQSSLNESIPKDNPGFKMLAKMGWTEGTPLGKTNTGLTEPVPLLQKNDKAGLGVTVDAIEGDIGSERKQVIWKKTQRRYDEINTE